VVSATPSSCVRGREAEGWPLFVRSWQEVSGIGHSWWTRGSRRCMLTTCKETRYPVGLLRHGACLAPLRMSALGRGREDGPDQE
jgi:hypothetical protein